MSKPRNYTAIAMNKRYGRTTSVMKDRREPRGGDKNEMHELIAEHEWNTREASSTGISVGKLDKNNELELILDVNGHKDSCWISKEFWIAVAKKAGWL